MITNIGIVLFVTFLSTNAYAKGTWEYFATNSTVKDIVAHNNLVWVSREDGLYLIDITDMSYIKVDDDGGALAMDEEGTLWIVRKGIEILTFDGNRWQRHRESDEKKMYPEFGGSWLYIQDAAFVDDTHLWIDTLQDILIFNMETKKITIGPGYDDLGISSNTICVTENGDIWLGGYDLWYFNGETWTHYTTETGLPFNNINDIVCKDNKIWVGTPNGSFCLENDSFTIYDDSLYFDTYNEFASVNGYSWFAGYEIGRYDGEEFTYFASNGPVQKSLWSVGISPQGHIWFGTELNGYYSIYDGNTWDHDTILDVIDGQMVDIISSIGFSSDSIPWLCTIQNRLYTQKDNKWVYYGAEKGWEYNLNDVAIDKSDGVWVANVNYLKYWNGIEWKTWDFKEVFNDNPTHFYCNIMDIDIAQDGTLWLGCNGGVLHFDGETYDRYIPEDGLVSDYVNAICEAADGSVWFGTENGVSHFTGTEWMNYTVTDGLSHNLITSIAIGHDGTVWLGTDYGLNSIDDSGIKSFTTEDGLINNDIRDIAIHPDGTLWIATAGGASHYIPENVITSTPNSNLPKPVSILTNYPNPFNPSTTIEFSTTGAGFVSLSVYNLSGQKIRELVADLKPAGTHSVIWNGRDESGNQVSSGIYIYQLRAGDVVRSNKMMLMK
ncbi:MAG: T9SS type A sorting domain-containing protein [Candidatus Latescibacteria bacterium]|nr:T9SS type A sorting domain-containing protein [Candidatus Latescibacterota bacterium]